MKKMMLGAAIGLTMLAASAAASAHVDVAVGLGVPGVVVPAQPVYAAPAPVAVGYVDDDWRARREWREHEWREHEWRRHQAWREHEWRERQRERWGYY
ncbi:conserved exported hypothetical protein [Paraburkholderia piptadeniae]|uniref:Uncharacterized protein n=1 Tax=Paraburkholderia piptadeniae TaxID=1701573 RepID=A0A1N7S4H6_9BURK|nr:hypothetical protein [Paraburkholderia piptadeniae]SIT42245.1 conserved exported hypothetical protein [Paraburkholderia piptadeniae]